MAWVEGRDYVPADMLIVDVDWAPNSRGVVYQVQDREQTWLDLNVAEPASGASRRLFGKRRRPGSMRTAARPG